jgi:hypothetical protein
MAAGRAVDQPHPLPGLARAANQIAHFEAHPITGPGGLGDQDVALREPVDIAPTDLLFGQPGFRRFDILR